MSDKLRVNIRPGSKVFCVSHRDDPDGLASAALVHRAANCRFALAAYEDLDEVLADVPRGLDWLVITDLGISERREIICNLPTIASNILYADHHLLSAESKRLLRRAGVIVRHSLRECTSVLVWDMLRDGLPKGAINLAAYGAKTDPLVSGPLTQEVLLRTSRHLVAYEGHLLALALSSEKCTVDLRRKVVEGLASMQLPHLMRLVRRLADQQATRMSKIQRHLQDQAQVRGQVAIARASEQALGMSAELLLGVPNIVASLVYDSTMLPSQARISARATDECHQHLGRLMFKIAGRVGGSGGGHRIAAGAVVPTSGLQEFLRIFVKEIGN